MGLLFVAVSIRADAVSKSAEMRTRIAEVLTVFLAILLSWLCVALPNPADVVLGVELLVVASSAAGTIVALRVRAEHADRHTDFGRALRRWNPSATATALMLLTGVLLVLGVEAGLFLLAFATAVGLVGGVLGAWLVLVGPLRDAH